MTNIILPMEIVNKILIMRPRHPVAELLYPMFKEYHYIMEDREDIRCSGKIDDRILTKYDKISPLLDFSIVYYRFLLIIENDFYLLSKTN